MNHNELADYAGELLKDYGITVSELSKNEIQNVINLLTVVLENRHKPSTETTECGRSVAGQE